MTLRAALLYSVGEFEKAIKLKHLPVAKAATAAIRETGELIKVNGRANIAAAGFGARWQNALRVDIYPKGSTYSINAAGWVYHKIPYAGIFERGGTIRGKPLLWVPLSGTPKKAGGRKMTPAVYQSSIGKLVPFKSRSGKRLLGARLSVSSGMAGKLGGRRITAASLRKGRLGGGKKRVNRTIPLFVGLPSVTIKKRLAITQIVKQTATQLAALYTKHFEDK